MRLQIDIIGIFRFLSIVQDNLTVQQVLDQVEKDFKHMYELAVSPKFIKLQNEQNEEIPPANIVSECLIDNMRVFAVPDTNFCDQLKKCPWQVIGIEEQEFEVRLELLKRVFGEEANIAILRSCLVRASGQLSKAVAIASYIRPDVLGTSKKLIFVRPRQDK